MIDFLYFAQPVLMLLGTILIILSIVSILSNWRRRSALFTLLSGLVVFILGFMPVNPSNSFDIVPIYNIYHTTKEVSSGSLLSSHSYEVDYYNFFVKADNGELSSRTIKQDRVGIVVKDTITSIRINKMGKSIDSYVLIVPDSVFKNLR